MKILVVNAGSSSLKYQLFDTENYAVLAKGLCECIGIENGAIKHKTSDGRELKKKIDMPDHAVATKILVDTLTDPEYGCIRDRKFYDRVKDCLLLPLTDGTHVTVDEYLAAAEEKHNGSIYYASDKTAEAQYIAAYTAEEINVALLDTVIDIQLLPTLEEDKKCKFIRVDADIADVLKGDGEAASDEKLEALFRRVSGDEKLTVKFERLKDASVPAVVTESEQSRRMGDMMRMYGMGENIPHELSLTLNLENSLIASLASDPESETSQKVAKHIWSLSMLTRKQLTPDELRAFLSESYDILGYVK